jgi:hypothetical protein
MHGSHVMISKQSPMRKNCNFNKQHSHLRGSLLLSGVAGCSSLSGCLAGLGARALLGWPRREEPYRDLCRDLPQTLWRAPSLYAESRHYQMPGPGLQCGAFRSAVLATSSCAAQAQHSKHIMHVTRDHMHLPALGRRKDIRQERGTAQKVQIAPVSAQAAGMQMMPIVWLEAV